ncbi:single-stranded-DNA-specific exonuclease RecJ [Pediococcus acidilactici]|uniref:single-stranded-DNA-specific exonuclease RecJ n=1 Tax=Pediococcus acidilactici TaxID=1254 RepID=UPI0006B51C92|nr:single-stranded-DNA-specific exonuclease RecJ [Pediococcus acidilactici]KAF0373098.1 single-stranded-DNA-specific exonuclease RecJ [Pediococcus acidilactici]KAF0383709.1 single-stranded-DNA-specific exonuclease RecJ [Pediococcus acidilactici]KAF0457695.1 single-stranded-DNA-specific exonuclease RecJ [Pediococcus acidilactici]KAF0476870.1 single-stranded-DNA-specific exonuclease RecJ [Pediococcus acidilactici]KAF0537396.1 single-stranded-DNA-specific exonuclease RecJ [Pediococcus acidilactic
MKDSRFNWQVPSLPDVDIAELAKATQLDPIIVRILVARGFRTADEMTNFLAMDQSVVHDPFLLHDMQKAVERIMSAIEANEKILVYGDYDADGVTSTTIMYETLAQLGADVNYFVPNRFKDGYGPNLAEYQHFINNEQVQLIVTVDNGVAGNEAINYAQEHGVDVVVTDHHEMPDQLPNAYAIVHPRHPEGEYPFGDLSGVGVAFKVACALLEEVPEEFLDLYAIGTIADLVSMTDENRLLVKLGLQLIPETSRIGLQKLIAVAGVETSQIDEETIGFTVAPRINAVGRLGDASQAVKLLTTFDEEQATAIAKDINATNTKRQGLVNEIYEVAAEIAKDEGHRDLQTLVISGHDWHQGVLGIVASRLVELTNKPTIVLSDQNQDGVYKGSGRSVANLNLFEALNPAREHFEGFGGHHMAIGITVKEANLPVLADQLEKAAEQAQLDFRQRPQLNLDATVAISELSTDLVTKIKQLGPFGMDNPVPKLAITNVRVTDVKAIGQNQAHLKFTANQAGQQLAAIAFQRGEIADKLSHLSNTIDLAGTLGINEWRGNVTLQLMTEDLKINGLQVVDQRTTNLAKSLFRDEQQYIFFNPKLLSLIEKQNLGRQLYLYDSPAIQAHQAVVLVDCPLSLKLLRQALQKWQPTQITTYFFHQTDYYASGMPSRTEFATVFAAVKRQPLTKAALLQLGKQLKIDQEKVNFMVKVFFELNFVKMEQGKLLINDEVQTHQLSEAPIYQKRLDLIQTQEKLLYSNGDQLATMLTQLLNVENEGVS